MVCQWKNDRRRRVQIYSILKLVGDLVYLNIFGVHIVYVNSRELAHEIFEKRSSIYSDRMVTTMIEDMYVETATKLV